MSKYTTEIRFICETSAGLTESTGADSVDAVLQQSLTKVFNFNFPIFDENYRSVLETKILKHYYTREIAFESVGLWKLKLNTKLNEIMPYYNKLYKSELLQFDPLTDTNLSRTRNNKSKGTNSLTNTATNNLDTTNKNTQNNDTTVSGTNAVTGNTHSSNTNNLTDAFNDTPQGEIDNVKQLKYLTTYDEKNEIGTRDENTSTNSTTGNTTSGKIIDDFSGNTTNNSNSNSNGSFDNTDDYLENIVGKQGADSYADLLIKFRQTFLNIDMKIIEELSDLFFTLY